MIFQKFKIFALASLISANIFAADIDEAKVLYQQGSYTEAASILKSLIHKAPKNATYNHWYGACLYELGETDAAEKYLKISSSKGISDSHKYMAKILFKEYDFRGAVAEYENYTTLLAKTKKTVPEDVNLDILAAKKAETMIENVQKVQIIDSINISKENFIKNFHILPESGYLSSGEGIINSPNAKDIVVFMPERKDNMLFGVQDENGRYNIMKSSLDSNGKWSEYTKLPNGVNTETSDERYPFMMADGITLYFSSNGEGSIGGYDIFVTRKNLDDDTYYQAQNVGMPFNSIYDDYMMVIDEVQNVGWFVTDRNQIEDKLTLYTFIPNAIRENYDSDDTNIKSLAKISRIKDTWVENNDYDKIKLSIEKAKNTEEKPKAEFHFSIRKGVIYTQYSDFKQSNSKLMFKKLLSLKNKYNTDNITLKKLRVEYATVKGSHPTIQQQIQSLEKSLSSNYNDITNLENQIRKNEL